jgi:hypothetical protein
MDNYREGAKDSLGKLDLLGKFPCFSLRPLRLCGERKYFLGII